MRSAGTPGAYAAVIHHVGRRSGTAYRTPISPVRVDGGFAVGLPYGTRPDWVKNVLAAGSATLEFEGETFVVEHPEVVAAETVRAAFGISDRRAQRVFAVDQCLRVRTARSSAGI
jgi:deazaflavin-dependent oxidoreductase (nitroreductase family)